MQTSRGHSRCKQLNNFQPVAAPYLAGPAALLGGGHACGGAVEATGRRWRAPPKCLYFRAPKRRAPAGLPLGLAEQCPRNQTAEHRNVRLLLLCCAARITTQLAPAAARIRMREHKAPPPPPALLAELNCSIHSVCKSAEGWVQQRCHQGNQGRAGLALDAAVGSAHTRESRAERGTAAGGGGPSRARQTSTSAVMNDCVGGRGGVRGLVKVGGPIFRS